MPAYKRLLRVLGSLRTTLVLFVIFVAALGGYYLTGRAHGWLIAVPLLLFAANLVVAIFTHAGFARRLPLLSFHLALLAILVLVALGRLTYLKGEVEVTQGEAMPETLSRYRAGPLHRLATEVIGFTLEGFHIEYDANQRPQGRASTVSWQGKDGARLRYTIDDLQPLIQAGYRFYSSKHKGFAPVFYWQPKAGVGQRGVVHLPAYPLYESDQSQEWQLPGTDQRVWVMLQMDERIITPGQPSVFHIPEQHRLVIRYDETRHEMLPGDSVALAGGQLRYEGLRTWMGFVVFYDWTLPWLLAAGFFAVFSMGWYFWIRCQENPWLDKVGRESPGGYD